MEIQKILKFVQANLPKLGPNKQQELVRLLYEIAKREDNDFKAVFKEALKDVERFQEIKDRLVQRRYPRIKLKEARKALSFPLLDLDPRYRVNTDEQFTLEPQNIFIEESVFGSFLAKKMRESFPGARIHKIGAYADHIRGKEFTLEDYNQRKRNFYIVREQHDFFLSCPCSMNAVGCGYHNMKLVTGCAYDCMYCFMQAYINSPGIVCPANIEGFFEEFQHYPQKIRLGNGQFTDSLLFDDLTEFSPQIIDFFRTKPQAMFEFKTKSDHIRLLLESKPADNIVVSWSLNPQKIVDEVEFFTAPLKKRLEAAAECSQAGYRVGFHFDPIIYYEGWEQAYRHVVEQIFQAVPKDGIAWISLGTLRMTPRLKQAMEARFPENKILDEEMIFGYDKKLRYSFEIRKNIYHSMKKWIRQKDTEVPLYLCMESARMCQETGISPDQKKLLGKPAARG